MVISTYHFLLLCNDFNLKQKRFCLTGVLYDLPCSTFGVVQFLNGKVKTNTGCSKSSFLYFISLYFSTIGLGKQTISTKVVSFNIIHYFHTFCTIFWLEYSICVLPPQRCTCASMFSSHIFFVFHNPDCSNFFLVFLWISRKINPLNAKTFSCVRA